MESKIAYSESEIERNSAGIKKLARRYMFDDIPDEIQDVIDETVAESKKLSKELEWLRLEYSSAKRHLDTIARDHSDLQELIKRVQFEPDYDLRIQLREHIRNLIEQIDVFFAGSLQDSNGEFPFDADRFKQPYVKIKLDGGITRIASIAGHAVSYGKTKDEPDWSISRKKLVD